MKLCKQMGMSLLFMTLSSQAMAHGETFAVGFYAGLFHPVSGLDHLLVLVLAGLLATSLYECAKQGISSVLGRRIFISLCLVPIAIVGVQSQLHVLVAESYNGWFFSGLLMGSVGIMGVAGWGTRRVVKGILSVVETERV